MARYAAFLLRIWRTGEGDDGRWAIRLEHLPDGQGARLDSLEALMAYLAVVLPTTATGPTAATGDQRAGSTARTGG